MEAAYRHLKIADQMISMSYPLLKDPKLLVGVVQNLHLAHLDAMRSVMLHHDLIPTDSFEENALAIEPIVPHEDLNHIKHINSLIEKYQDSGVVFSRKDAFVVCSDDYDLSLFSATAVTDYVNKSKTLLDKWLSGTHVR